MASDFPPGFLLVGLIAASSALIFWLLPPNAGAEMANRVPPTDQRRRISGWADVSPRRHRRCWLGPASRQ